MLFLLELKVPKKLSSNKVTAITIMTTATFFTSTTTTTTTPSTFFTATLPDHN